MDGKELYTFIIHEQDDTQGVRHVHAEKYSLKLVMACLQACPLVKEFQLNSPFGKNVFCDKHATEYPKWVKVWSN